MIANASPEGLAVGHALTAKAHELIAAGGLLGLLSILAGLVSRRFGAPVLLVFLALGMLVGEDGLGVPFDDFYAAYLIGSIALAIILFEGGVKTRIPTLRLAFWPAFVLATVGVAATAGVMGGFVLLIEPSVPLAGALLAGAVSAPTDAAAVSTLLRRAQVALPERVSALLEVESGLNDPMSVFLTILLIHMLAEPGWTTFGNAALLFGLEMLGGAAFGCAGGWLLSLMLRRLRLEAALATVLVLAGALALFGLAQSAGTSGFLAIYIAALITGATRHEARHEVETFFEGMAWLSQIVLFLMLGLLVTPSHLLGQLVAGAGGALVLIFVARPVAVLPCLLPFGYGWREIGFASWVGLRGAVPIYLSILPALADPTRNIRLFDAIFVLVVASLMLQGWTIAPAARLLGFGRASGAEVNAGAAARS